MALSDETIQDLPPSAKLVLKVLEYNGGLTQKRIVEKSRLSQRTVRDALARLRDAGVVEKEIYIPDARQSLYKLSVDIDPPPEIEDQSVDTEIGEREDEAEAGASGDGQRPEQSRERARHR